MGNEEFAMLKKQFEASDTDKKIEIYISADSLNANQYKELLRLYPYEEIDKLESALA